MNWAKYICALSLTTLILGCSDNQENGPIFTSVVEGTTIQVPALTGGLIESIYVDTGAEVTRQRMLMQIDTLELSLQKSELQGAFAEVRAQEILSKTQEKKAKEDQVYLLQKYNRFKELFEAKSINQQTLDDLKNKLDAAETAVIMAQQQFNTLAAKREQLEAKKNLLQKKISDAAVLAPINGIITEKYFEPGEAVPPMQPVFELVDLKKVWLKIYLPETLLGAVKIGQEVKIHPDGLDTHLTGKLSWVSVKAEFSPKNILTPETRTSLVYAGKIEIDNPEQILKQGMPVEVRF